MGALLDANEQLPKTPPRRPPLPRQRLHPPLQWRRLAPWIMPHGLRGAQRMAKMAMKVTAAGPPSSLRRSPRRTSQ